MTVMSAFGRHLTVRDLMPTRDTDLAVRGEGFSEHGVGFSVPRFLKRGLSTFFLPPQFSRHLGMTSHPPSSLLATPIRRDSQRGPPPAEGRCDVMPRVATVQQRLFLSDRMYLLIRFRESPSPSKRQLLNLLLLTEISSSRFYRGVGFLKPIGRLYICI